LLRRGKRRQCVSRGDISCCRVYLLEKVTARRRKARTEAPPCETRSVAQLLYILRSPRRNSSSPLPSQAFAKSRLVQGEVSFSSNQRTKVITPRREPSIPSKMRQRYAAAAITPYSKCVSQHLKRLRAKAPSSQKCSQKRISSRYLTCPMTCPHRNHPFH
jgi:hypothetical protein